MIFLLNGCAESLALLGTSTSNGKILQSSLNSAVSYGVKKQTGKTPLEHAVAYAERVNPEKKQETCISFIERTRSDVTNAFVNDALRDDISKIKRDEL